MSGLAIEKIERLVYERAVRVAVPDSELWDVLIECGCELVEKAVKEVYGCAAMFPDKFGDRTQFLVEAAVSFEIAAWRTFLAEHSGDGGLVMPRIEQALIATAWQTFSELLVATPVGGGVA